MRNCLVLGSGRSGTSLVGGMLHEAGYFMGDRLHRPRDSNPKGFFEWHRINRLNETLLGPFVGTAGDGHPRRSAARPGPNQGWLLRLPAGTDLPPATPGAEAEIRSLVRRAPFGYKDPRFCHTLPAWRPFLPEDTAFLCVFRDPAVTVASILKECRSQAYLADLEIDEAAAFGVWTGLYERALSLADADPGRFRFLHYERILDGGAIPGLARFLEAPLTGAFADPRLRRSAPEAKAPPDALALYEALCGRAGVPGGGGR